MASLVSNNESVAVAETSSGGLISASLLSSENATKCFKGSGVRLPVGISTVASQKATAAVEDYLSVHWGGESQTPPAKKGMGWEMIYPTEEDATEPGEEGARPKLHPGRNSLTRKVHHSSRLIVRFAVVGSAVHALELAHAAKINLKTHWGIGESGLAHQHHRSGDPAGLCFVAVAGPTKETTGVLRLAPRGGGNGAEHMVRFTEAAVDLMRHLQEQRI